MLHSAVLFLSLTQAAEPAAEVEKPSSTASFEMKDAAESLKKLRLDKLESLKLQQFKLESESSALISARDSFFRSVQLSTAPYGLLYGDGSRFRTDITFYFPKRSFEYGETNFVSFAKYEVAEYYNQEQARISNEIAKIKEKMTVIQYQMDHNLPEELTSKVVVPVHIKARSIDDVSALLAKIQATPENYCNLNICIEITGGDANPETKTGPSLESTLDPELPTSQSVDFIHSSSNGLLPPRVQ